MIFGSVCSGIEAASVAWHPLGWRASFLSEIDAFPRALLAHHYGSVPLHGDFTTIQADEYEPIDLLVGGTPCQSFSIAGLRGGLGDDRGNLALEFLRLAGRLRPTWIVWENVPGVLSSVSHDAPDPCPPEDPLDLGCDGAEVETEDEYDSEELHAFNCFLAGLSELGYGFAYRVLDAQYFGLAQRRERVFVVGYLGGWRRAAAVLFERESLSGHPAPSRETGQSVAGTFSAGAHPGGYNGQDAGNDPLIAHSLRAQAQAQASHRADSETYVTVDTEGVAKCLSASHTASGRQDPSAETYVTHTLRAQGFDASEDGTGRGVPLVPICFGAQMSTPHFQSDIADTLQAKNPKAVAFAQNQVGEVRSGEVFNTLNTNSNASGRNTPMASVGSNVRRLTPRECERLQGFPDDYTLVPYRGKPAADGPRYKALGNSMAVPVMHWIGRRIEAVEAIANIQERAA